MSLEKKASGELLKSFQLSPVERARKNAAAIALLDSFTKGDAKAQRETGRILMKALNENRRPYNKLFPKRQCSPHPVEDSGVLMASRKDVAEALGKQRKKLKKLRQRFKNERRAPTPKENLEIVSALYVIADAVEELASVRGRTIK